MSNRTRVTMTQREADSSEGHRLIDLILHICHDGDLLIAEIEDLHVHLRRAKTTIYAFEYLRAITREIVADGCVDHHEALRLKKAFERVVPKSVRGVVSTHLADIGLPSIANLDGAPAWTKHPATGPQLEYIIGLGGTVSPELTKGEASAIIDDLLRRRPPTPRQMMLIRFFDQPQMANKTKAEVSAWIDKLFSHNPRYELAWDRFKRETDHDPLCKDPTIVPIGAYREYLGSRNLVGYVCIISVLVIILGIVFVRALF